jgi:hypothetical protein
VEGATYGDAEASDTTGNPATPLGQSEVVTDAERALVRITGTPAEPPPDLARAVALAVALEALSVGSARVVASELRGVLEAMAGPRGELVDLAAERARRGK